VKAARLVLIVCLAVVCLGCGTLDIDMGIVVTSPESCTTTLHIVGTGVLGQMMSSVVVEDMGKDAVVDRRIDGDTITISATRTTPIELLVAEGVPTADTLTLRADEGFFVRHYVFDMRAHDLEEQVAEQESEFLSDEDMSALIESSVDVDLSLTLPGKLSTHNGTLIDQSTVTWDVMAEQSDAFHAEAVQVRWGNVALVGGAAACAIAAVVVTIVVTRKRKLAAVACQGEVSETTEDVPASDE